MARRLRHGRSLASLVAFFLLAFAPVAFAQTTTPPKHKKKKPATTDTAPAASSSAPADAAPPAEPPPAPAAETPPPPAEEAPPPKKSAADTPNSPPDVGAWDIGDTHEEPGKSYMFIGLRYRGTIVPQFLENIFVNDGATIYSNSIGVEFDLRKNGSSTIPWIQYADYDTGDILFFQKGQPNSDAFHSVINSSLKAIYVGVDELWSTNLVANKLDFEYGFGVGIGFLFGHLVNDWVFDSGNSGPLSGDGHHYTPCANTGQGNGCNPANHTDPNPPHVGGHVEPNWFGSGSVPVIFPHIAVPQLSLRYKPIKQLETRFSLGFSLTGFWFGLSADYGLEQRPEAAHKSGLRSSLRDTL
jgi:hypothetical protein